jgi:hypothetical protein
VIDVDVSIVHDEIDVFFADEAVAMLHFVQLANQRLAFLRGLVLQETGCHVMLLRFRLLANALAGRCLIAVGNGPSTLSLQLCICG